MRTAKGKLSLSPSAQRSAGGKPALRDRSPSGKRWKSLESAERELKQARDYAQAIVEAVPPLLVLDMDLRVKTANESFYKHFRVSPPQTENCLVYKLGNGQWNIPKLRTFLEEVLPRHSFFNDFEVTHEFKTIGRRTILLSGRPVNHLQRILLFIDDITERVESRAALRASEIRYRRLFEAARDGILILDPDTRKITDANPFMTELLGYPHQELLGKELWEIGLLKDEKASRIAFRELQRKSFIRYEDLPLQSKKGKRHEVEFVSNLYEEDGRYVIQCNIRDITERKRAEQELLAAKNEIGRHATHLEQVVAERTGQLRETIRELEGFSYSVSHDMRAPLRAMQSFAQFLVDEYAGKLDEQGLNYLQQIMRSAVRLDRLIQDVLSYARILHVPLPIERVDLDRLVRDIVETFPNVQPIKPEIQIKGTLPQVMANEALLGQCVSNLLSNGAKFVSPGATPRLKIWAEETRLTKGNQANKEGLSSSPSCPTVKLFFRDNGIGIAPEDRDRIFRLFERIHPATEYEGTGIGLTVVRKATERMGAQVGFDSQPGKGSNFWIQLKKG
jgi:PAS domain S-box-containing protein